ncbi:NAD(P)/FAD-dependent oxidoreductase [Kineococcus indalonis]|uniref:NAD(P)/FAD-dependent oxidoreductase n=1 Tax=Kineococcus indalonis TaxID=2696566 RepID=UPI00141213BE|nr:FAD-dependent oxidoreductase [Kineococcus indalonis]NAZ86304.1 NAD(P)-binding protein [Kineococcus indalonis]
MSAPAGDGPGPAATGAPVVVVGAGIAGAACARVLTDAGVPVRLLDRGRRPGGRMSGRRVETTAGVRVTDLGASYFTVSEGSAGGPGAGFAGQVADWEARGLARRWTDTFAVLRGRAADGARLDGTTSTGPWRWGAPAGLRSLVDDLLAPPGGVAVPLESGTDVETVEAGADGPAVDGRRAAAVVLAMPDPQAADLLPRMVATRLDVSARWHYRPSIAVYAAWPQRWWPDFDGAFVNDNDLLTFLADDGARRGDGAPVLVAHTAPDLSADHLDDPVAVVAPVVAELGPLLAGRPTPVPSWNRAHRWSLAQPYRQHAEEPFGLDEATRIAVCGDSWGRTSKVETAWASGTALGRELAGRLAP